MLKKHSSVDWLYYFKFNISGHMTTVQQLTRLQSALLNLCWEEFGLETKVTTICTECLHWVSLSWRNANLVIANLNWLAEFQDLERDGHLHCLTMEAKYGLLFCSRVPSYTGKTAYMTFFVSFLFFFCHICRTSVCWDPGILLPWQRDVTTSLSFRKGTCLPLVRLPRSLARNLLALPLAQTVLRNS